MGQQVIVFNDQTTGCMSVVIPADPEADLANIIRVAVPKGVPFHVMDRDELPSDREFRNAWRFDHENKEPVVDLTAAAELTKERLRLEREPLLASLDVEFMRAVERGSKASEISAIADEKQRLRDITALADEAKSLDELRALKAERREA